MVGMTYPGLFDYDPASEMSDVVLVHSRNGSYQFGHYIFSLKKE
jgi:hypothetical protein